MHGNLFSHPHKHRIKVHLTCMLILAAFSLLTRLIIAIIMMMTVMITRMVTTVTETMIHVILVLVVLVVVASTKGMFFW